MLVFGASLVANVRSQVRVESATREGSDEPENCGYVTGLNRFRSAIRPQFQSDSREDLGMSSR
jgi:hypothetical protein